MKNFIRILLSIFVLVFGAILLLQTPFVKNQIKKTLITAASDKGISLSIEKLDGNLPLDWKAKNVSVTVSGETVSFQSVKMRVALFPLFKKELEILQCKFQGGSYGNAEFEGIAKGRVTEERIRLTHFLLEGEDLYFRFDGTISPAAGIKEGNLTYQLSDLSLISPHLTSGKVSGSGTLTPHAVHLDCAADQLSFHGTPLARSTFSLDGMKKRRNWKGDLSFEGGLATLPVSAHAKVQFTPSSGLVTIEDVEMTGPHLHLFGKLDLDPSLRSWEGTLLSQVSDLSVFAPFFPQVDLKGKLGAKFDFQTYSECQDVKCQIEAEEISIEDFSCHHLTLEGALFDFFNDTRGECLLEASGATVADVNIQQIRMNSVFEPGASPFTFFAKGNWESPFQIEADGCWVKKGKGVLGTIETLKGTFFQKEFTITESCAIDWNAKHFKLPSLSIDVGQGSLHARIDLSENTSLIKLKADDFPLECIPIPYENFSMAGVASLDIDLISWEQNLEGNCNIALKRALFFPHENTESLTTKGSMQIHLSGNIAQIHAELKASGGQFAHFSGTIPITFRHLPFQLAIDEKKPFCASLVSEGKLEDLFTFINIGHQRIEGWLTTNLFLSKTLEKPMLQGDFSLSNGLYENYFSGTQLKEISARGIADRQNLLINDLYAIDGKGGSISCKGNVLLQSLKQYPFAFNCVLNEFEAVTFDTITGKFSGNVTISGDKQGAIAKGNLKVDEATFHIPDTLPTALPDLPITFVNPPESLTRKKTLAPPSSPLQLDLNLEVPGKAFVEGRGLSAELQGNLYITGDFIDIKAKGELALVKGSYIFSGKVFDLTQGEVIFNDKPTPTSYISITGECDLPDVTARVVLRGPITMPNLSFQSSPQLPTSSLLAQILFNKDISEINAAQALQLAQTVISLSSQTGPDIIEKIRKTLGIDRLTFVTSENDPGKISLQIGKYLMKGVLLTLSQGAESRNVSVEVDLTKGVRFQAEMNEDNRKFSLKWHHHY